MKLLKHRLVLLGFMSDYHAYLDVTNEEALRLDDERMTKETLEEIELWKSKGKKHEPFSEWWKEDRQLKVVEFNDHFGCYDAEEDE
jgi:thymidylate kinase